MTSAVLLGPSAGEGWLPGGGVGKLQEASARLPLHRPAALCQDEEDGCGVSPLYLFLADEEDHSRVFIQHRAI